MSGKMISAVALLLVALAALLAPSAVAGGVPLVRASDGSVDAMTGLHTATRKLKWIFI